MLRRLRLEDNKLLLLEQGVFTGVPALKYLDLSNNRLETITFVNILPLWDNLVNASSTLDLTGEYVKMCIKVNIHKVELYSIGITQIKSLHVTFYFSLNYVYLSTCYNNGGAPHSNIYRNAFEIYCWGFMVSFINFKQKCLICNKRWNTLTYTFLLNNEPQLGQGMGKPFFNPV